MGNTVAIINFAFYSTKLYYEKKVENGTDFIEVDKNLLLDEWQKDKCKGEIYG